MFKECQQRKEDFQRLHQHQQELERQSLQPQQAQLSCRMQKSFSNSMTIS